VTVNNAGQVFGFKVATLLNITKMISDKVKNASRAAVNIRPFTAKKMVSVSQPGNSKYRCHCGLYREKKSHHNSITAILTTVQQYNMMRQRNYIDTT